MPVGTEGVRPPSGGCAAAMGCSVVLRGRVHHAMATILWSQNHVMETRSAGIWAFELTQTNLLSFDFFFY